MSYDLNFWKYKPGVTLDHQATYESLSEGETVEGLEELPIDEMLARLQVLVPDAWEKVDDQSWESSDRGIFQVSTTPQSLRVDCYGMKGEDMNVFIDLGSDFDCPLYDPQVGARFDG